MMTKIIVAALIIFGLPSLIRPVNQRSEVFATGVIEQKQVRVSAPAHSQEVPVQPGRNKRSSVYPLGRMRLYVSLTDRVEKGQELAKIENKTYQLAVLRDEFALKSALLRYKRIRERQRPVPETSAAPAFAPSPGQSESTAAVFNPAFGRKFATGTVSKPQPETTQTGAPLVQIQAKLRVEQARAALTRSRYMLRQTIIRAPVGGQVVFLGADSGELVFANQIIAKIGTGRFDLRLYLEPRIAAGIPVGSSAAVYVDSYPDHALDGHVEQLSSRVEPAPSNLAIITVERLLNVRAVILRVQNRDGVLKSGLPADAVIDTHVRVKPHSTPKPKSDRGNHA